MEPLTSTRDHYDERGRRGYRVKSLVAVHIGAELECCIFAQDAGNLCTIDGATVRWSRPREFSLVFTKCVRACSSRSRTVPNKDTAGVDMRTVLGVIACTCQGMKPY